MNLLARIRSVPIHGVIAALALAANSPAALAAPAPPKINLDDFDHWKQTTQLANGITMGFIDIGPRDGRPVVLIHGYTDNARDWILLLPYLDKSVRYILVDIRGHGASSRPECCYTLVDFAYDVRLLLDKLKVADADIVGHSLGSLIGQAFAEYWPERTHRLVLVSSTGGPRAGCTAGQTKPMDYRSEIAKLKDPIDPESPWMIEWWASPTPVDGDFLRRQRKDAAAIPVNVWLAVLDQALQQGELQSRLLRIEAPTLLIWGDKDPIMVTQDRCSLMAALPSAQVKLFPNLGHNPFWEDPQGFTDALQAFLRAKP